MKRIVLVTVLVVLLLASLIAVADAATNKTTASKSKLVAAKEAGKLGRSPTARMKCLDECVNTFKKTRASCKLGRAGTDCKKKAATDKESCLKKCPRART